MARVRAYPDPVVSVENGNGYRANLKLKPIAPAPTSPTTIKATAPVVKVKAQ